MRSHVPTQSPPPRAPPPVARERARWSDAVETHSDWQCVIVNRAGGFSTRRNKCSISSDGGVNNPAMPWKELERRLSDAGPRTYPRTPTGATARRGRASGNRSCPRCSAGAGRCRTPSCTATPTSRSSTARRTPKSSPRKRPASASKRSPSPTTTASTGSCASRRRRVKWGCRRWFGPSSASGHKPQNGAADPEGNHLVVLARDPAGYARLARTISARADAGSGEGQARLQPLRARAGPRRSLLVLTGCRKGTVPSALLRSGPAGREPCAGRPGRAVRHHNVAVELWDHDDPLDFGPQRCARADRRARPVSSAWPPTTCTTPCPRRRQLATCASRPSALGAVSTRSTDGFRRRRLRTCAPASNRTPLPALSGRGRPRPPHSGSSARSTCISSRPSCRPTHA